MNDVTLIKISATDCDGRDRVVFVGMPEPGGVARRTPNLFSKSSLSMQN
jgi:hypothetical protein